MSSDEMTVMQLPASDLSTDGPSGDIGAALEQLMSTQCLPPRSIRRVYRATELPIQLQRLLCTVAPDPNWRAFTDGAQWWFGLAFERATRPGDPVLEFDAYFFCKDALLWAGGHWTYTSNEGLALREIYNPTAPELG